MTRAYAGLTIRRKLTSLSVLSSMTALISASIVFFVYDARTFRDRLTSRLGTEAQIISFNTVTPLLFNDSEAAGAQMAFIGSSERTHLAEVLAALKGGSVLTVGDMDRFADGGGMVGFRLKDSTVRFEVNLRELKQARLQMSSQIIRLAQRVIEDEG
jgi:hypothetical protein